MKIKKILILSLFVIPLGASYHSNKTYHAKFYDYYERLAKTRDFGGWSIAKELFDHIKELLPKGSTLLEFGSGWASGEFSKHYTVYSVEHDPFFLNQYNTNYIYAPIKDSWYDPNILAEDLPKDYDLILVDGPVGNIGRYGFYVYFDLFRKDVPIIIDDVNRPEEYRLMMDLVDMLGRSYEIYTVNTKQYGIIFSH
ncbi:MAG: hypothetical protein WD055_02645 [Candidatus Dependentiae bacterium]